MPRESPDPDKDPRRDRATRENIPTPSANETFWPESQQVTNEMDVLTDHGAYWRNDEQVVRRIAAEIDQPFYQSSRYWTNNQILGPKSTAVSNASHHTSSTASRHGANV